MYNFVSGTHLTNAIVKYDNVHQSVSMTAINYMGDWSVVVKACVEPSTFFNELRSEK